MATLFGSVALEYEDVRPGYPPSLASAIAEYAGGPPSRIVEVGAGTGKGTEVLALLGVPLTCVEPDARMAGVLGAKFPQAEVVVSSFEQWTPPPGGVPMVACALAWHWLDAQTRNQRVFDILCPGGTLAVFGHQYGFADPAGQAAIDTAFASLGESDHDKPESWFHDDIANSGLWTDVLTQRFVSQVDFTTERYLLLHQTFSPFLRRTPDGQAQVLDVLRHAVDGLGGVIHTELRTTLVLARRG